MISILIFGFEQWSSILAQHLHLMGAISPKLYQLVTQLVIDTLPYQHLVPLYFCITTQLNSNTLCPSVFATGHTDCDSQSANTKTLQFHLCQHFFIIITITSTSLIQLMCQLGNNWKQFPCIFMTLQRILLLLSPSSSIIISSIIILIILILSDSSSLTATNSWTSVSLLVTIRCQRHRRIGAF